MEDLSKIWVLEFGIEILNDFFDSGRAELPTVAMRTLGWEL